MQQLWSSAAVETRWPTAVVGEVDNVIGGAKAEEEVVWGGGEGGGGEVYHI